MQKREKIQEELHKEDVNYLWILKRKLELKTIADVVHLIIKDYKRKND